MLQWIHRVILPTQLPRFNSNPEVKKNKGPSGDTPSTPLGFRHHVLSGAGGQWNFWLITGAFRPSGLTRTQAWINGEFDSILAVEAYDLPVSSNKNCLRYTVPGICPNLLNIPSYLPRFFPVKRPLRNGKPMRLTRP